MKKIKIAICLLSFMAFFSCETNSGTKQELDKASKEVNDAVGDATTKIDTSLASLGDSVKADFNKAADKIKQHTKELGEAAKQKANEGIDKIKEGTQKIKEATKAGVDAAKEKMKK